MTEKEKDFMRGFGVAISYLVREWNDKGVLAVKLAESCGFNKDDFKYCDKFDLEIINKLNWDYNKCPICNTIDAKTLGFPFSNCSKCGYVYEEN